MIGLHWFKTRIRKTIPFYLYFRLIWNRGTGHTDLFIGILQKLLMLAAFLKIFNLDDSMNLIVVTISGIIFIISLCIIGHLDVKYNIMSKELTLGNKYNKEIQKLLKKKESR